jgi:uncharacterized protein YjiS (DUF1127 family)
VFKGTLKGVLIDVPNVEMTDITYVKRSAEETKSLRNQFNNIARKDFLNQLARMDDASLKNAGLSPEAILQIRAGYVPDGFQVHHKLPLDDGGDNSFDNLVLIRNDPYHKIITNYQNSVTRDLSHGNSKNINWPIPNGVIYVGNRRIA